MQTFEATRPAVGAQAVGVARAAYEYRVELRQGASRFWPPNYRQPEYCFHAG